MSHNSALEAKNLADKYHSAGKEMFRQATESYDQGQEFWATATHALLEAKRREVKVEQMLEAAKKRGIIDYAWKEAV